MPEIIHMVKSFPLRAGMGVWGKRTQFEASCGRGSDWALQEISCLPRRDRFSILLREREDDRRKRVRGKLDRRGGGLG